MNEALIKHQPPFCKQESLWCCNQERVSQLQNNNDLTHEITDKELKEITVNSLNHTKNGFVASYKFSDLESCNFFIITVPTPVDNNNQPLLMPSMEVLMRLKRN